MKIAVIGAGIIGITTAYELAVDGHDVTVFERRNTAAEETSFANAGIVAPGYVTPWAAPSMSGKMLSHFLRRRARVKITLPLSPGELSWMWKWYQSCKLESYLTNQARMLRLALYSRERLDYLTEHLELEYDRSQGFLVLLRSEKDSRVAQQNLQMLRDSGVCLNEIDADEVRKIEPAISTDIEFFGGIHLFDDGAANCRQFAQLLKNKAQNRNVKFEFKTTVAQLNPTQSASILVAGEATPRVFDHVVLCAGQASAQLFKPLGLKIPMVPVYGYSISASIREPLNAPRSALMDERYKVAISRIGNRVRVAGGAEIGGELTSKRTSSIQTLYKVLQDWFPNAAQHANLNSPIQEWKGACPILPDGLPIIGKSGFQNLWLNVGHGSSGWAMSCGSARALADLIGGKAPDIDMNGLGIGRLG